MEELKSLAFWVELSPAILAAVSTVFAAWAGISSARTARMSHRLQVEIQRLEEVRTVKRPVLDALDTIHGCVGFFSGRPKNSATNGYELRREVVSRFEKAMDSLLYLDPDVNKLVNDWYCDPTEFERVYIIVYQQYRDHNSGPSSASMEFMQRKAKEIENIKKMVIAGEL
ncbi:hypothetical protein KUV41_11415 [Halomonas sp. DP8Y7-1]|uniref:hypothetical protein n=1 Tax=Halomonas sp. DP8Y7-1 TaxID=2859078 RepID=UPI001C938315|nr:hypothetical protein [Halomonas sp. DP8Y7-1]MBY6029965.1 hypothetical protein [Halomonas sp. DP8Y7-1]